LNADGGDAGHIAAENNPAKYWRTRQDLNLQPFDPKLAFGVFLPVPLCSTRVYKHIDFIGRNRILHHVRKHRQKNAYVAQKVAQNRFSSCPSCLLRPH